MKRRIAFLLIITLVLGLFAGCKSNEDEFSMQGIYAENEQAVLDDEVGGDIAGNNEQENKEPSQDEPDKQQQQKPTEQVTPDPKPEKEQEQEKEPAPEPEKEQEPQEETPDSESEQEPEQEPEQEQEQEVGEGGGPLFEASENPYKDSLKILAFGNSFSKDAMQHLWDIANSYGVKKIVLGNLNIGGCSLEQHYENMTQNAPAYTYSKNSAGTWENTKNVAALTGLQDEDWDIITIQQASDKNADSSTYNNLEGILRYLEQRKPKKDTKILWHMTWAYQSDSKKAAFAKYNNNQIKMYEALLKRVKDDVLFYDNFAGVIPAGTAIQNLRKTSVGDTLTRDGYHMSYGMGRYVVALTWYCYITGADPFEAKFVPSEDQAEIYLHQDEINQAIADAIRNPYAIT